MNLFHPQLKNEKLENVKCAAEKKHADDSMLDEMHDFRALHVGDDNGSYPTWHCC